MNHEPEPPSWMSGAAAVGTGAGPPSEDQEAAEDRNGQASHFDVHMADEDDAPRFSDNPPFGELPADEARSGAPDGSPGYGPAPAPAAGMGAVAPDTDPFRTSGQAGPGYDLPAETAAGYAPGPHPDFGGNYPGEYAGPYQGGGYPPPQGDGYAPPPGDGYAPPPGDGSFPGGPDGSFPGPDGSYGPGGVPYGAPYGAGPAAGVMYGTAAPGAGYVGQENGAGLQDPAPPLPGQYPPPPLKRQRRAPKVKPSMRSSWRRHKSKRAARGGRQAQLTLARLEPWSVMKFSFVISLVAFIVLFVAVAVLYAVLSGLGVFDALQRTIESITSSQSSSGFNLNNYLSASRVLGYTGLLGAIHVVLITALSTVGSVLYNITADLAGGVEVTLKESD
ncbi:MAG: DUF3566 domain-containing protein [Streptomyces sp.]|nr:DUF3566 domain-containing protein [Streptomyces sp.]